MFARLVSVYSIILVKCACSYVFTWPSIFAIIRFPNDPCSTKNGLIGTCYTHRECLKHRGQPQGICASGYGVCCLFETTCGGVIRENNTYFLNQDYPNEFNLTSECDVIINPIPRYSGICQYLVTMELMELSQPRDGRCEGYSDSWTFTVGNRTQENYGLPVNGLCGILTSQHFYLDTYEESLAMKIAPAYDTDDTISAKKWRIRISQFTCDSEFKAPLGCLQYFTTKTGLITSLNYAESYYDQLLYSACLKSGPNDCKIQWKSNYFEFGGVMANLIGSGVGDVECTDDYVIIPSGSINAKDRYCGSYLNIVSGQNRSEPIISDHKPFTLRIKTDQNSVRKGFKMTYNFIPCT